MPGPCLTLHGSAGKDRHGRQLLKKSEVVVAMMCGLRLDQAGGLAPGGGLPIVLAFLGGDPGWESLVEIRSERKDVGFVHIAELDQAIVRRCTVIEFESMLR